MNIQQAKEEVMNTVKAYLKKDDAGIYKIPSIRQRPLLLMGPPGIGKTQIMEQIACECKIGLVSYTITHHTRQSAVGLPFIKEEEYEGKKYSVTEYTMSEIIASIYKKIKDCGQKEGILFIDEINCVSETLTPTMLQFLQCKQFGNQKIPEGWIIVAAGNPPEYNKSVKDFDMVTLDRVRYISIEADLNVWKRYARNQHIHGAVLSYLELRPKNFYCVESDVDGLKFVTARGWEDLSSLMKVYDEIGLETTEEIVHEFIRNDDIAQDAAAYIALYNKYRDDYGISDILNGKVHSKVYERLLMADFDERLSVVNLILDAIQKEFINIYEEKYITDSWYSFLKELQQSEKSYKELLIQKEKQINNKKENGFLSDKNYGLERKLTAKLHNTIIEVNCTDNIQVFEQARVYFSEQTSKLSEMQLKIRNELENVFDFIEAAFSSGQELLIYVTGLTMGRESSAFLAENVCERYQKYNEQLLAGTKKTQLLQELSK